jgi:hypothetical protein
VADEIEQVRRTETRRGRRPIDSETVEENLRKLAALREILKHGTLDDLKALMREYDLSEGSAEWKEALRIWNGERGPG